MKKETLELGIKIFKLSEKLKCRIDKFQFTRNSVGPIYEYRFIPAIYLNHQKIANKAIQIQLIGVVNSLDVLLENLSDTSYEISLKTFENITEEPEEVENIIPDPFNVKKVKEETPLPAKKDKCPHGHVFGKDCDEYKECGKCPLWEDCSD